jgi:chemosensory pili system protein ChpB (putative protein-glutamate methylesterase)
MTQIGIPRLVIVADNLTQRFAISEAVRRCGFDVLHSLDSKQLKLEHRDLSPDLWLLDVYDEDTVLELLGEDAPLMMGIPQVPPSTNKKAFDQWVNSLSLKLNQVLGHPAPLLTIEVEDFVETGSPNDMAVQPIRALSALPIRQDFEIKHDATASMPPDWQYVCVLAASMGGPEAVKLFLDHLPITVPVALVLVQHIDPKMQAVLPRILGRHNDWQFDTEKDFAVVEDQVSSKYPNSRLMRGRVLVVPAQRQIDFGYGGEVFAHQAISANSTQYEPWPGQYQPSINDVIRRAAGAFGPRLITIVFSGMGDDGSHAVKTIKETGGVIWAQSSLSCVCSSQPDNIRASGEVSFSGSPDALAKHLQQFMLSNRSV